MDLRMDSMDLRIQAIWKEVRSEENSDSVNKKRP